MDNIIVANYNPHQDDDDTLTWLARFMGRPNKTLSDRFGYLNRFSKWNSSREGEPVPVSSYAGTQQEFECILDEELTRIERAHKPLYLLYSGGVDSSCLLCSLLMRGKSDVCVLYSDDAKMENPTLFSMLLQRKGLTMCHMEADNVIPFSEQALKDGILLSGTGGDKLFYSYFFKPVAYEEDSHWENVLKQHNVAFLIREQIKQALQYYDVPVKTSAELLFWLSFSSLWYWGMPNLALSALPNSENHWKPFTCITLQQWALVRMPGMHDVFCLDPVHYKVEMKRIIEQYTHDHEYTLTKNKRNSMRALRNGKKFGSFIMDSVGTWKVQDDSCIERYRIA